MVADITRLRPTRRTLVAVIAALWAMSFGAAREFVWADLRGGLVRTTPLHWVTRALIRVGIVLQLGMVAVLLFTDALRDAFPLIAGTNGTAGRGELVPSVLLPITMFMVAVAWSFLLTGALHSHPGIRVATVIAYLGTTVGWLSRGLFGSALVLGIAWAALLAVPVVYAVRWRGQIRPALEFPLLLGLVGTVYVITQRLLLDSYLASGVPLFIASVETTVLMLGFLVTPLLILIGLDIAEFAYRAGGWAVSLVGQRFGRVALGGAVGALLIWRLWGAATEALTAVADGTALWYLGGLGVPVVVGLTWLVVLRLQHDDPEPGEVVESAVRNSAKLAVGYVGWQVILTVAMFLVLGIYAIGGVGSFDLITRSLGLISSAVSGNDAWRLAFSVGALGIGLVLARRGHPVMSLYLALVGAVELYNIATDPGGVLAAITWRTRAPITFWWTVAIAVAALYLLARRRLTTQALEGLLLVTVITVIAGGADAVGDPFSPFFAFAGVGIIAFGIVWDMLTVGSWANEDSVALPRPNRMLLYLGYVLFSVTVINWALATHDLSGVNFFTEGATALGFEKFGAPVLYAIYALTFARILRPPSDDPDTRTPAPAPQPAA